MLLLKTPEWEQYMIFIDPFISDRYLFGTMEKLICGCQTTDNRRKKEKPNDTQKNE